jgi:hypothetical protein
VPRVDRTILCAVFADDLGAALDSAFFSGGTAAPTEGIVLTCDSVDQSNVQTFTPIGVYEFSELPGHRVVYPPVLEMLDYCFTQEVRRLHLASTGPTGLAGLFISRLLKLPVEATHTDALPRLARVITKDGFVEDLVWKYLVWFYNQMQAVYVPSREALWNLEERGVGPDKLRILAPRNVGKAANSWNSSVSGVPTTRELKYQSRRGAL